MMKVKKKKKEQCQLRVLLYILNFPNFFDPIKGMLRRRVKGSNYTPHNTVIFKIGKSCLFSETSKNRDSPY